MVSKSHAQISGCHHLLICFPAKVYDASLLSSWAYRTMHLGVFHIVSWSCHTVLMCAAIPARCILCLHWYGSRQESTDVPDYPDLVMRMCLLFVLCNFIRYMSIYMLYTAVSAVHLDSYLFQCLI